MTKQKSDLSRAFSEDGKIKTHIGGQALLEGVMMRGKLNWAAAIRTPTGEIYVEQHDLVTAKPKHKWLMLPFIRGCYAFVQSLVLGYKALEVATNHAFDEEGETFETLQRAKAEAEAKVETEPTTAANEDASQNAKEETEKEEGESFLGKGAMAVSMVIGVVLGVVLFIVAPAFVTNFIIGEYDSNPVLWNITDGILRVAIFIAYIWLISRMSDIKRMFAYHGAEHKTIHCFEHGLELTPENARKFPRLHVRCGTAFLIMVMIIAIFVYSIIPVSQLILALGVPDGAPKLALVILVRIIFMPLIAGISYEITVKWAGSNPENPLVKIVLWPGMQMQYLTTNEPDDSMLECAIAAMKEVIACEEAAAGEVLTAETVTEAAAGEVLTAETATEAAASEPATRESSTAESTTSASA